MAKANIILLNSVLWNLREVTKLAEKIKKHCGDVECTSWRYPLANCSELKIFNLLQNNRNLDNYTYILELTYDRLIYVFNLMIKYLESKDSMVKFRPNKNVCRPKTLSLATVLHMIWERIRTQQENPNVASSVEKLSVSEAENQNEIEIAITKSSTFTQSEVCSISVCSCCEMVQEFVTHLVVDIEKIFEEQQLHSAIAEERKVVREYLAEMTHWSAMSRWLKAIFNDLTTLTKKAEETAINSRHLKNRLDNEECKLKLLKEKNEEEIQKLKILLEDREVKNEELKKDVEKCCREKNQLNEEIKLKNSEMTETVSSFKKKMESLQKSYEFKLAKKKEKLKKEAAKELDWKKKLESECKNKKILEGEISKLKEMVETLKETEVTIAKEKDVLEERCRLLEIDVGNLENENSKLNDVIKEKEKMIDEYSQRIMKAFPELNGVSKPKYQASGNPQIDMENQIEANKLRIGLLCSENEKLKKTLEKLKSLEE